MVDMSKAMNNPTSQFKGDESLEKEMEEARVGQSDLYIYEKHNGELELLEQQHNMEMSALVEKHKKDKLEFQVSARQAKESLELLNLLDDDTLYTDSFETAMDNLLTVETQTLNKH